MSGNDALLVNLLHIEDKPEGTIVVGGEEDGTNDLVQLLRDHGNHLSLL
jgi:hypothetical protein